MTAHPIDTEALREQYTHLVEKYGPEAWAESRAHVVLSLLDALAAAEHRATRAEARIQAVEDVLDQAEASINRHPAYTFGGQRMDPIVNGADIRRALDT